jgi:serine/threonine protein kinase
MASTDPKSRILIADDEAFVRQSISELLKSEGYETIEANDGRECLEVLAREKVDIMLLDVNMPNMNGMEAFRTATGEQYNVDTIMISGSGSVKTAVEAIKIGAYDFLEKPFSFDHLLSLVNALVEKRGRVKKLVEMKQKGTTIGKYRIQSEISRGGFAIVYRAVQADLQRSVALKILHPHLLDTRSFTKRFYREAQITASLSHPNIVQIYDYGQQEEQFFLAMELVEGDSLERFIIEANQLPIPVLILIAIKICKALEYAHKKGVLHRDIKPQNVLIARDGMIKLADFGLARCMDSDAENLTRSDLLAGTPQFISPELIEGKELTYASDIFSLGTLLYVCATLRVPFPGTTLATIMHNILHHKAVDPRKINSQISRELGRLIMKCLNKKTVGRFETVHDVRIALESCVQRKEIVNSDQLLEEYFTMYYSKNRGKPSDETDMILKL